MSGYDSELSLVNVCFAESQHQTALQRASLFRMTLIYIGQYRC